MSYTLRIPELGEDVETVDVIAVLVTVGNALETGQAVIEVETEKASVEVPTDTAGTVLALHVKAGDSLSTGDPILTLDPASTAASKVAVAKTEEPPEQPEATGRD